MQVGICKAEMADDNVVVVELSALKEYNDAGSTVEREWWVAVVDDEYLHEG